jgi:hypothetical protein
VGLVQLAEVGCSTLGGVPPATQKEEERRRRRRRVSDFLPWVLGQRKMSQVLDTFGMMDFTMLRPVIAWREF